MDKDEIWALYIYIDIYVVEVSTPKSKPYTLFLICITSKCENQHKEKRDLKVEDYNRQRNTCRFNQWRQVHTFTFLSSPFDMGSWLRGGSYRYFKANMSSKKVAHL